MKSNHKLAMLVAMMGIAGSAMSGPYGGQGSLQSLPTVPRRVKREKTEAEKAKELGFKEFVFDGEIIYASNRRAALKKWNKLVNEYNSKNKTDE